nr:MAG TPA: hypothetical protein [Caudoviricetes sp.]
MRHPISVGCGISRVGEFFGSRSAQTGLPGSPCIAMTQVSRPWFAVVLLSGVRSTESPGGGTMSST